MSAITQKPLIPDVEALPIQDHTHERERRIFEEALRDLPFGEVYAAMTAKGFRWREAAFVAWATLPKKHRVPATKMELAELLGCSRYTVGKFAQDKRLGTMRLLMARSMYLDALPDIVEASIAVAVKDSYKATPERNNIVNKVLGLGQDNVNIRVGEVDDLTQLSDEDLLALADGGGEDE